MATLTDPDFVYIQQIIKNQPTLRTEFRGWTLTKAVWRAAFQATEDYVVNGFSVRPATSIRAAIESQTGATTSARAQALFSAYVAWKLKSTLGG